MPNTLAALRDTMQALARRQEVVASNIANADTPGFKAVDVKRPSFARLVREAEAAAGMNAGRPSVTPTAAMERLASARRAGVIADREITEVKPDGNNVTIETQMLRMSGVQQDYATAASLYRRSIGMLRTAIGRNA